MPMQVWVVVHVERARRGGDYHAPVGVCSTMVKVEELVARRFPKLTRYLADPGEFGERGGRFVEVIEGVQQGDEWVRVDRVVVDDPTLLVG